MEHGGLDLLSPNSSRFDPKRTACLPLRRFGLPILSRISVVFFCPDGWRSVSQLIVSYCWVASYGCKTYVCVDLSRIGVHCQVAIMNMQ